MIQNNIFVFATVLAPKEPQRFFLPSSSHFNPFFALKIAMLVFIMFFCTLFQHELQVEFRNVKSTQGALLVAVYDRSENFMNPEKACAKKIIQIKNTGSLKVSLGHLPPGQYALSCFHDLNGNGVLDTNVFGYPQEPYGFSNNARPKFRAPTWQESVFTLSAENTFVSVSLR